MPALPAGEESLTDAIASQAIEAEPSFGQIKPLRGPVVRAATNIPGTGRGGRRVRLTRCLAFWAKEQKPRHSKYAVMIDYPEQRQC